ncbi:MAG: recombination mediator RecR [Erysipelotrichaceae bacterium]
MYPEAFEKLVEFFRQLPGVGAKTAERYAFSILETSSDMREEFAEVLKNIEHSIHYCHICHHLSDSDTCSICKDTTRDEGIICVVQSAKDVIAMEKTMEYKGRYHVLNGVISASKGVLPQDINLDSLVARVNENTKEIIVATNPTIDGETTALYISKLLENKSVVVTRLAHGLPMGGHLDYADQLTLIKAIEGRKRI